MDRGKISLCHHAAADPRLIGNNIYFSTILLQEPQCFAHARQKLKFPDIFYVLALRRPLVDHAVAIKKYDGARAQKFLRLRQALQTPDTIICVVRHKACQLARRNQARDDHVFKGKVTGRHHIRYTPVHDKKPYFHAVQIRSRAGPVIGRHISVLYFGIVFLRAISVGIDRNTCERPLPAVKRFQCMQIKRPIVVAIEQKKMIREK